MAISGLVVDTQLLFELCRCQLPEARVRSDLVVLTPELLDDDLRIDSISEPLHVRHSSRNLPLKDSLLPFCQGFPGSMCAVSMFACVQPVQNRSGDKLRAVVRSQVLGAAVNADQLAQHLDDSAGADAAGHIDRQALARELIDHRQTLQLLAVGAGIEHKVVGPDLAHGRCRQRPRATGSLHAAAAFFSALAA